MLLELLIYVHKYGGKNMSSKRIYITLNEKKDKDKVILDYLSSSYSESDTIKDVLYRIATNSYTLSINNIEEIEPKGANSYKEMQKVTKIKENEKGKKGENNCKEVVNAHKEKVSEKVQNAPISSEIASLFS